MPPLSLNSSLSTFFHTCPEHLYTLWRLYRRGDQNQITHQNLGDQPFWAQSYSLVFPLPSISCSSHVHSKWSAELDPSLKSWTQTPSASYFCNNSSLPLASLHPWLSSLAALWCPAFYLIWCLQLLNRGRPHRWRGLWRRAHLWTHLLHSSCSWTSTSSLASRKTSGKSWSCQSAQDFSPANPRENCASGCFWTP